jgi:DNA-binding PadR family transcriptional regulator
MNQIAITSSPIYIAHHGSTAAPGTHVPHPHRARPRTDARYGIIGEVTALSDGHLSMRPGTLYGALDRLTDEGLITTDREEVVDGRLRRYYRLTDSGETALTAETERLSRNLSAASERLRARAKAHGETGVPARKAPTPGGLVRPAGGVA